LPKTATIQSSATGNGGKRERLITHNSKRVKKRYEGRGTGGGGLGPTWIGSKSEHGRTRNPKVEAGEVMPALGGASEKRA